MVDGVAFVRHLPTGTDWGEEAFSKSSALAATLKQHENRSVHLTWSYEDKINSWKTDVFDKWCNPQVSKIQVQSVLNCRSQLNQKQVCPLSLGPASVPHCFKWGERRDNTIQEVSFLRVDSASAQCRTELNYITRLHLTPHATTSESRGQQSLGQAGRVLYRETTQRLCDWPSQTWQVKQSVCPERTSADCCCWVTSTPEQAERN